MQPREQAQGRMDVYYLFISVPWQSAVKILQSLRARPPDQECSPHDGT